MTYYLGKKLTANLLKYLPVFSLGFGVIFFYIRLNFISYSNSFESIFDTISIIILLLVFSFALLEVVIIEVVENTKIFGKGIMVIRKAMKLAVINKKQV